MKTIFFDTSDTLYHNSIFKEVQENQFFIELSERRNIHLEDARKLFNETKKRLQDTHEHVTKISVMMELGIGRMEMHNSLTKIDAHNYLQPDLKLGNILSEISGQYKMGIITNVVNAFLKNILDALQIDMKLFQFIVSVNNTTHSKPNDEPFQKAIELSGHEAKDCIYVGDSLTKDMIPARRNGMQTIWVNGNPENKDPNQIRIDTIYDIQSALKKLNI